MSLSERIRPEVECAPWVIEEVRQLEAEIERLKQEREQIIDRCAEAAEESLRATWKGTTRSCVDAILALKDNL
jgi:hypothetical protein